MKKVELNIVGANCKVLFQTDDDHAIRKFLQNVYLDDGSKIDVMLE